MYIVTESIFCTSETQHCKSTILQLKKKKKLMTVGSVSPGQAFPLLSKSQHPSAHWASPPDVLQTPPCQCKAHLLCESFPDASQIDLPAWCLHCSRLTSIPVAQHYGILSCACLPSPFWQLLEDRGYSEGVFKSLGLRVMSDPVRCPGDVY